MDLDAGYNLNVLDLYIVTPERIQKIYSAKPEKWGPSNVRWSSRNELLFDITTLNKDGIYMTSPARLVIENGGEEITIKKQLTQ
jgi:hypothetical protein